MRIRAANCSWSQNSHEFCYCDEFRISNTMFPRGTPDIGWSDLLAGLWGSLLPGDGETWQLRAARAFCGDDSCLACLSVRSGLDLLCRVMNWPAGSEVLISAITLDDMVQILREYKLVAVPVDVDPETLAVDVNELENKTTPRTRAILIAHLFGSRMPLDRVVDLAARRHLLLIEDCAQAFAGDQFRGHPASDVSLFSFGPIKTKTALGGAIVKCRNRELCERMKTILRGDPRQQRREFLRRVVMFALLKGLSTRLVFSLFVWLYARLGGDYDSFILNSVRGFSPGELLSRIRRQPSIPMLRLLTRRLQSTNTAAVRRRIDYGCRVLTNIPFGQSIGAAAAEHTHWVVPVRSAEPEQLVAALRSAGYDATRAASRMCAVAPDDGGPPPALASTLLAQIVYLPMWPNMPDACLHQMTEVTRVRPDRIEAGVLHRRA